MSGYWTLDDIPWDRFDPSRVKPGILAAVKAAAMVERNGNDYAVYLNRVFHDDPEFCKAANAWALEEVQHGAALGRWAEMADGEFDFNCRFQRFADGYQLPLDATESVRGSRAGELLARCMVEVGTSSYYSALRDATDEPVLKEICARIAQDEVRHYKLFHTHMQRYLKGANLSLLDRLRVALGRIGEADDDELAYAYYAANASKVPYEREAFSRAYMRRAYPLYRRHHIERAVVMVLKALDFNPRRWVSRMLSYAAYGFMRLRSLRIGRTSQGVS